MIAITKSGSHQKMLLLMRLQEDMEQRPFLRVILTTTPITNQMRLHSEQVMTIQREDQAKFTEIETQKQNSQVKKQFLSIAMSRTKQICMDQDNL